MERLCLPLRIGVVGRLPGVQDTYIKYAEAGDQIVGRQVAGLPADSPEFAVIAPHFAEINASVESMVRLCYPTVVGRVDARVLQMCLASLVYHYDWLKVTAPSTSPLWNIPLFKDLDQLALLKKLVVCGVAKPNDTIRPTGLPAHIANLRELNYVNDRLEHLTRAVNAKADYIVEGVLKGLDERQTESHLTPLGMKDVMARLLDERGLTIPKSAEKVPAAVPEPTNRKQCGICGVASFTCCQKATRSLSVRRR